MNVRSLALSAVCAASGLGLGWTRAQEAATDLERERNVWPVVVQQFGAPSPAGTPGRVVSWTAAGPLLFRQPAAEGGTVGGLRPLWVETHNAQGDFRSATFLYPLFSYAVDENTYRWNIFELVRRTDRRPSASPPRSIFEQRGEFEVWPFWFSRETGDPEFSYRGLFPIAGTVRNKLGMERFTWFLFPLYGKSEARGAVTTHTPWPFIRVTRGAAHGGGLWPLFTSTERPGVSRETFYFWPLGYNVTRQPTPDDSPGTPAKHDVGFLPFFAKSTGPGYINESYAWPFFGYTDQTITPGTKGLSLFKPAAAEAGKPEHYHETRYFWPLLVQGRGDVKYVNRWGPFYTHSIVKGYDKTWYAWPLVRHAEWNDTARDVARTRTQLLYFVYWSERQHSVTHPNQPVAGLTHLWPLYSGWDNGAGRKQWQIFSPLDVFFPQIDKVKQSWTPLFAIARREQRAPGDARTSLFWNAITWERRAPEQRREFHLGPLLSISENPEAKRVAIGNGLFGFKRGATGTGWRLFWLDFRPKPATSGNESR